MRSQLYIRLLLIAMLTTSINLACSSGGGTGPSYDIEANLRSGWSQFSSGNYNEAISTFTDVLDHSEDNSEALLGRGWSYGYINEYSSAISDFNDVSTPSDSIDAHMGLAAIYRDYPNYQQAVSHASTVIESDSNYVFSQKTSIDYKDAHLIKAQSYFRLGKSYFDDAHTEIDYLCNVVGISNLPNPDTISDEEYEMALSEKLEQLSVLIGN